MSRGSSATHSTSISEDSASDPGFVPLTSLRDANWSDDESSTNDVDYGTYQVVKSSAESTLSDRLALHRAVDLGDVDLALGIIGSSSFDSIRDVLDGWGTNALHSSVFKRDWTMFETILVVSDPFVKCQSSPLAHVIVAVGAVGENAGFAEMALEGVRKRPDGPELLAETVDEYGRSALRLACEVEASPKIVHVLLDAVDAIAESRGQEQRDAARAELLGLQDSVLRQTAVHALVSSPAVAVGVVEEIVARCTPEVLELKDIMGRTALHLAAAALGRNPVYDTLLAAGASEQTRDVMGRTPADVVSLMQQREETRKRRGSTIVFTHDACLQHHTCSPHASDRPYLHPRDDIPPENVNRLRVLLDQGTGTLRSARLARCGVTFRDAPLCELGDVLRVHDWSYVHELQRKCEKLDGDELDNLDGDTGISRGTFEASLRAAGAACAGVDLVVGGDAENVFCAVRPPGHHAGPTGLVPECASHGFCFFNNVAIAAGYAMTRHRDVIKRVAIVDFDVHHGNGTEVCVEALAPGKLSTKLETPFGVSFSVSMPRWKPWLGIADEDNVLFCSVHGWGKPMPGMDPDPSHAPFGQFYPGSGMTRLDPTIVDVGQTTRSRFDWRNAWREVVLPRVAQFRPDLILVSAGFDAHAKDAINGGYCGAIEADYVWITRALVGLANEMCEGRIVSVLEGGYRIQGRNVSAFARSVHDHVAVLAEARTGLVWDTEEAQKEREIEAEIRATAARVREEERLARIERQRMQGRDVPNVSELGEEDGKEESDDEDDEDDDDDEEEENASTDGDVNKPKDEEEEKRVVVPPPPSQPQQQQPQQESTRPPRRRAAEGIDFKKLNEELEKERAMKKAKMDATAANGSSS